MRVAHGQGAPAFNVESCGSGFYPLQWACMTAVGCLLAREQLLRFQVTPAFSPGPRGEDRQDGKQTGKKFRPGVTEPGITMDSTLGSHGAIPAPLTSFPGRR